MAQDDKSYGIDIAELVDRQDADIANLRALVADLEAQIESKDRVHEVHMAFYNLTVKQRDLAWRQLEAAELQINRMGDMIRSLEQRLGADK
jgi:hypothetical protein